MKDTVGKAIFPADLPRVLGLRFFSKTQIAEKVDLKSSEAEAVISCLLSMRFIEAWEAVRCPDCGYMWPSVKASEEEDDTQVPGSLCCPICNEDFSPKWVYRVYKMLKPLP